LKQFAVWIAERGRVRLFVMCTICNGVEQHKGQTRRSFGAALAGLCATASTYGASLCETGRRQSPIDIVNTSRQPLPALVFDYHQTPLKLANDGSTVRVRIANDCTLQIDAQVYSLYQFHFHTPGGEAIAGKSFPMVAHLLHKSRQGQLVAVAVHLKVGAHSDLIELLLGNMPVVAKADHAVAGLQVNASALLPAQRGYYRYTGSLTAEPCTEGVDWIVLKQPIELSSEQLARYKHIFPDNMRNVQPVNQRVVLESD